MPDSFHCELEAFFEKQLERTNYWLSFAEAKNAALIAFNVASIVFIAEFQKNFRMFSTVIMILFAVSCIICLISFFPKAYNRPKTLKTNEQNDNLIFWNDIAMIKDEVRYIELVIDRYFPGKNLNGESNKLCYDLASEIVINSRIARSKYNCFKKALKVDMASFLFCILLFVAA